MILITSLLTLDFRIDANPFRRPARILEKIYNIYEQFGFVNFINICNKTFYLPIMRP